jgi:hypothetical protein
MAQARLTSGFEPSRDITRVDHARFDDVSGKVEDGMKLLFDPTKFHFSVWVWIHDLEDPYWRREK